MIRDWDELSEEWQETTDALQTESYPTGPFSGSQSAEDASDDGNADSSTVRVIGDQQRHSGISANSRPWERSQLKDMFSPLSLERLFKAPVGSRPDSTPPKGMASRYNAVSERWADQALSDTAHSVAMMHEEANALHRPEEKGYPSEEPLVHWDHQIPAHAFAELSLFVDPDVHPKTQLADLTGLDVSASRIEGNQDISLSLGERSYRDRGGGPSSEGTPKKHRQHAQYWGNGSIGVPRGPQVPKRTEWPEAHKKLMLPRNNLGADNDDPPRRPSTGRDTTLSNTSWPDGADLFQVDYDTKTRSYLEALVDELRSSKQQPQNQGRNDGGDTGIDLTQNTSANIELRPIASTTHDLIPSHDSQLEPSITHLNHKSYTVNNAPYYSDEDEANEPIDIPPSAEPASADDCPRNVSMPADLQSYPSDIDFLEDVFENSIRASRSRGPAQAFAGSVEIHGQRGNHSGSPNKSSTKSESGRSSQSKILTIRNLSSAKNKSSVILSHLGASSQMRFNEDKQRWEENDDLMEEIPHSVAEGTAQASAARQEPAEQCITGTGPVPANLEQEAQYMYGSPDSGDIRSVAGCSDATVQGTETQPEIATTLSRQPGDQLQRELHEELPQIRSPTSVRSQRMVLEDLHTPAVTRTGSRFQSNPERKEEPGEPGTSGGMLPNLAKALKLQADWMTMTHLDLSRYGIGSVHSLKRHAPQVRTLKVNDNKLPYLNGVPETVAVLHAQNNLLSNITTFAHLPALQFLDISGNMVEDLSGLTCLPNLRELHAANNRIRHCAHLIYMPRLVRANLRGNNIARIELKFHGPYRLEYLDLSCNDIDNVTGIERLVCLRELILDQNRLGSLNLRGELSNMEVLSLNDNELQTFDGRHWPNLRRLSLDRNRIQHFSHEKYLSHLQNLSIERQSVPVLMIKFSHLRRLTDLRISGNSFRDLRALRHNIRLQFLEAQATGISHIPEDFARNLRELAHLNLSDNEITEIQTVRHLKSLRSLIMTGNAIEDFAMISEALKGLTRVEVLDFRHNPVTARFYAQRTTPLDESQWLTSDELFRKQLNDADFVRRTCYRSSLISILRGSLRSLDNIATGEPDKKVAKYQMSRLKSSLRRSMSSVTMGD
ncbi:hypothetical protein, variant [Spizellomyces punctatus DAOM BR117]|uniref:Uncharacterized protein n=1 Tax=Spizellomyces punctatus (strain DAOM BR117) TaxID=645134 RepID=A0A0L0HDP5_SPIPD|nr:hypothetical protein, variant [Spizellomyces punctatus DAOM BR117]KNC99252.1 hypothetical protein, variant [Spizellomyces punctatus DAOM BR117]|eukprot:XP_016607292.1 hypothetical protein, variant [Spizellomyces punctatus DAOM BR117]